MEFTQQLLVTYECVSAIGTSLDLKTMLRTFLRTFARKTGAISSAYWQKKEGTYVCVCWQGKQSVLDQIEPIAVKEPIQVVSKDENINVLYVVIGKGIISFLFHLDSPSLVTIVSIVNSIYTKLDNAISACLNHEELLHLNETLEAQVALEVEKNREKDKHILQQSRMAQMGEMISMIAHQWRQPLGAVSTVVAGVKIKLALNKFDLNDPIQRASFLDFLDVSLGKVEQYVKFLTTTIDDFRNFFKPDKKAEAVLLIDLINRTLEIIGKALEVNKITVHIDNRSQQKVVTYSNEVMQVILNILKNIEDITKEQNLLDSYIIIRILEEKEYQKIEIDDNAGGIPLSVIDHIFEPYFSTKSEKNGTGLGLYMSKTIIEEHCRGKIFAQNINGGARFTIILHKDGV